MIVAYILLDTDGVFYSAAGVVLVTSVAREHIEMGSLGDVLKFYGL